MDADALIERNRALVALAEQTRRGSREAVAIACTMRGAAKAVRDKAAHRIDTDVTWRLPATRTKSFVVSPRYVQSLQAEAAEIRARVQALVAAAKRSPSSETPD